MEHSLYEKSHPLRVEKASGIALGRITRVYPEERLCEVKTFFGQGNLNNNHIPKAQWLSMDAHPEGDESAIIPRPGALCLVFFVDGQPFVFGFFSPLTGTGSAADMTEEMGVKDLLNEGDRLIRTIYKNHLKLTANGECELRSTDLCKIILFPDIENLIHMVCQSHEFRCDGGTIDWVNPDHTIGDTYYVAEYRNNTDRDDLVVVRRGTIDETDSDLVQEITVGKSDLKSDGIKEINYTDSLKSTGEHTTNIKDIHIHNIKPDGTDTLDINEKFHREVNPDGSFSVTVGKTKLNINTLADGSTTMKVNGKCELSLKQDGTIKVDSNGSSTITVMPSGEVKIKTSSKITCESPEVSLVASLVKLGKSISDVVPLGNLLLKMINKNIAIANANAKIYATHSHAALGAAPPAAPMQSMQSIGSDVLSSTVKVQG